uniref:Uncharacterized protein n=1 Tax=Cacopsylla melanoneura TaxID=428564 RepID=A0A8D9EMC8_9HEMI
MCVMFRQTKFIPRVHSVMFSLVVLLTTTLFPSTLQQDNIKASPEPRIKNYWQDLARIEEYKQSKFKAFANTSDLNEDIANQYEAVRQHLVQSVLDETERIDLATLETNETARLSNNTLNNMVKKYFYFKSKYYFDINNWYYDIVFNMRKYFKDKHKYLGSASEVKGLVDMYQILNYERDVDLLFNNLAFKYRDKISSQMKSLRIKFYYALSTITSEQCEENWHFRDIILFAMGKQET